MTTPPQGAGRTGFSTSEDGDLRSDPEARQRFSARLGIPGEWAVLSQVHGNRAVKVDGPGPAGEADAVWTATAGLPLAVFTADCLGVVLLGDRASGVAHAGWRGVSSGVVEALAGAMADQGHIPEVALIGPGIGPCCFEVGPEVAAVFPGAVAETSWGTVSVDLEAAVREQLPGVAVVATGGCTAHQDRFFSHRRTGTTKRMASVTWV